MKKIFKPLAGLVVLGIIALFLLSGCTQPAQPPATDGNTATVPEVVTPSDVNTAPPAVNTNPQNYPVQIQNFNFTPATITIKAGDSVSWENFDGSPHTVTSDSGNELGSLLLQKGQTYKHTFNAPGAYTYHCSVHTSMKGTIIVE